MSDDFLWCESHRPRKVEDCVLPSSIESTFKSLVQTGELPNMIFSGSPGVGKTTVARALCDELSLDYIVVNGSEQGNIDTLRGRIKQFASTVSLQGGYKVVILDEADYLNCVDENETIQLSDGSTIKLKDMQDNKTYGVLSFNMKTGEFEGDTATVVNRTQKETYTIELDNGNTITVTSDHPLIVEDQDGNITERTIEQGLDGFKIVLK